MSIHRTRDFCAINATTVEVKFSKPVLGGNVATGAEKVTAGVATTTDANMSEIVTIEGFKLKAPTLSTDGKTLTLKVYKANAGNTADELTVLDIDKATVTVNPVRDKDDVNSKTDKYVSLMTYEDTKAPTITEAKQTTASNVRVSFSEPVDGLADGNITFKDADGNVIAKGAGAGQIQFTTLAANSMFLDLDLTNIAKDKKVTVSFNGLKDLAGNLVSPQPATIVVEKKELVAFAPSISTVTQTGGKTFNIKFSEDLDGTTLAAGNITLDNGLTVNGAIEKISASEYKVTTTQFLDGITNITVAHAGLVGPQGQKAPATNVTKKVTFVKDIVAPTATYKVVKNSADEEVIQLTFDKDVQLGNATVTGTQVKDFVTSAPINETPTVVYADGTGTNKKVVNVPLTAASLAVEGAIYNLKITQVQSVTNVPMKELAVTFTRGTILNTDVLVAGDIAFTQTATKNDEVIVTFSNLTATKKLDPASALNIANYTIDGAVIESAQLAALSGTTQVVTLKLAKNSNAFTGVRNATVKNVKIENSTKVMKPVTKLTAELGENVRPTVTKAEVTATNTITLTLSEAVKATTADLNIFEVFVGNSVVAKATANVDLSSNTNNKIVLTVVLTPAEIAEGVTVKLNAAPTTPGTKIVDLKGNLLDFTSIVAEL